MKKSIYLLGFVFLFSCNEEKTKNHSVETEVKEESKEVTPNSPGNDNIAKLSPGCYRMTIERDTAEMKIAVNGNQVSGDLMYNPYQKDGSFGKFSGTIENDVIRAWYVFEAEGMKSVREVAYKIEGNSLAEGFGDIDMKNDSVWFKYPQTLKFEKNHPFQKIDCK